MPGHRLPAAAAAALLVAISVASLVTTVQGAGSWVVEPNLPQPLQEVSVTALGGLVYVAGGSSSQVRSNAVYSFDPTTRVWTSRTPYPGTPRDHMGIAGAGGFLYLIGGTTAWPQPSVTTVNRYDPATGSWTTVAPLPAARGGAGVAVLDGRIYVAGGIRAGVAVNDFTVYDPATNAWTTLPAMPTARDHLVAAAVNGRIYALGGRNGSVCAPLNTVEVYDPATNAWSPGLPMPQGHAGHAVGTAGGHIQVFGGEGNATNCGTIAAAADYDPVANSWTALPDMPTPRHGTGGATIGTSVYLPGGGVSTGDASTAIHHRFDTLESPTSLPSPWLNQDIGTVGAAGTASHSNGIFTVQGAGADIWGGADGFHFVYQPLAGDGHITARVTGLQNTHPFAKAGVMIRQALTPGAAHALVDVKPGGGIEFLSRGSTGGSTSYLGGATAAAPTWLRLTRAGSTVTAYSSANGASWSPIASTTIALPTTVYVGLAVTSHVIGALTTAGFEGVTVETASAPPPPPPGTPPTVSLTSPAPNSTYTAPASMALAANASDADGTVARVDFFANSTLLVSDTSSPYSFSWTNVPAGSYSLTAVATDNAGLQTTSAAVPVTVTAPTGGGEPLPAPWLNQDVGAVGAAGAAAVSSGVFTVQGSGADIWGNADGFHFVYQPLSGDGHITARVVSLQNTHVYAKAGVMIRQALTAGSAHALLDVKPAGGLEFLARSSAGGATSYLGGSGAAAPVWVRLARAGSTLTAFTSTGGTTWTQVGSTSIAFSGTVYVGLAVTSHVTGTLMTATFDGVTVETSTEPPPPPPPGTPPTVSLTSPAPGSTYTAPATVALAATASDADGTIARVDFFANSTLLSSDTTSPYSFSWTNVAAGPYSLTAVATDNAGLQTTSSAVAITVSAAPGGGGGSLPSPWLNQDLGNVGAAGSATHSSGTFTVQGAGADIWGNADGFHFVYQPLANDGQITARVVSLQNTHVYAKAGVMIRQALTAGSAHALLDVKPVGGIEFLARSAAGGATSYLGGGTASAPAWLRLTRAGSTITAFSSANGTTWTQVGSTTIGFSATVYAGLAVTSHVAGTLMTGVFDSVQVGAAAPPPPGTPPTVSLTSPAPNSTYTAPANIALAATASDSDGSIARVDFFANSTLLSSDTSSPYSFSWTNAPAGSYSLTAVAVDNAGLQTTSAAVSVVVSTSGGGGLPVPWASQDIGNVGVAGSASFSNGTFTVKGAGADIWYSADSFRFVYQPLAADGEITARVVSMQNTHTFAKAGVMIRQSLTAGSAHALLDVKPSGGFEFMNRTAAGADTSFIVAGAAPFPAWLRLARIGNTVTASTSTDGISWTAVGNGALPSTGTVYVGLAVTSHDTTLLNTAVFDNVSVGAVSGGPAPTISFARKVIATGGAATSGALSVPALTGPTSLALGADGRLYVSTVDGRLVILTLDPAALSQPNTVAVTGVQELRDIYLKPSLTCNINGDPFNCQQLSATGSGRLVTGLLVGPESTPTRTVLYVSNSGLGQGDTDMALDTLSGTLTRLTLERPSGGATYTVTSHQDLVVGMPRSREVHAVNGMSIGPDGWLYLGVGGHTNAGQPSGFFANLPEYYLSASVVRLNLGNLAGVSLPLDVRNVRRAADMTPFQGRFELFSTGYRNPYDVAWHSNGRLYVNDNAANVSQGNTPGSIDGCPTPSITPGDQPDTLHIATSGSYGGHPNPVRGECVWGDGTIYTPDLQPDARFVKPITAYINGSSSDGLVEYKSNAFNGAMKGNLISATYGGDQTVRRVLLNSTGSGVNQVLSLGTFVKPLDVWTDATGNIFVAEYGANRITVLTPAVLGTCPAPGSNPATTDSDSDGYTDADEQENGTDPCSAASVPADFDRDFTSDLSDPDDDNDSVSDTSDQLYLDRLNGGGTALPLGIEWNPSDTAYGGVQNSGFTGIQISSNAAVDEASGHALAREGIHPGDAGGHMALWTYAGTAQGSANSQVNALQLGFDGTLAFQVAARITQPFAGATPAQGQLAGIFFGPGQDDFARLAIVATAGGGKAVQFGVEVAGSFTQAALASLGTASIAGIELVIAGNPANRTVTAFYRLDGASALTPLGSPVVVPASWFSRNTGGSAEASRVGVMVSHGSAPQTAFSYDYFRVTR